MSEQTITCEGCGRNFKGHLLCLAALPHKMRAIPAKNNQRGVTDRYPGGIDIPRKIEMISKELTINTIIPKATIDFLIITFTRNWIIHHFKLYVLQGRVHQDLSKEVIQNKRSRQTISSLHLT